MKIFQIFMGFCHWDATKVHPTLDSISENQYHSSIKFVEAPDYVFEGWGYDEEAEGDECFIKPTPPEGWLYDNATGTFYPIEIQPKPPSAEELLALADLTILGLEYENILLQEGLST